MDVLREAHEALRPGGLALDVRPVATHACVDAGGHELGRVDETEFFETLRLTDEAVATVVAENRFGNGPELERVVRTTYDSAEELLGHVGGWAGTVVPDELGAAVIDAAPPWSVREDVVFRVLARA